MLGQGGMGVVYRAFDPRRGAVVALKTLGADARLSVSRFKREFRSLADAVHPNLVRLYELAADGPRWYFTMELVEGVDFLQHVRPRSDAATDYLKLRAALRQLAEGVSALHARRILHRDLKPSNVKVASDGRVVLLDFGLAAEIGPDDEHLSSTPHFCGTMAYMPPEQAACLPLTPACDWYALGVMLYEALTGRLPYSGSLTTVLRLKQDTDPPSPSSIAADVPGDLETLCLDLMRRDPSERPGGREVLDRLGAANPPAAFAPRDTAFVGREETLQVLRRAFRDARSGRTTAVLVHGASGMGKSTLVAKFLGEAGADPRAVVLAGRCYESESVPFKTIDGIVDALAAFLRRLPRGEADAFLPRDASVLARVFPVFREVAVMAESAARSGETLAPHELRQRAFDAFRELLGRIGDRRPLVVALDDLQWGDADGAARLAELFRPADRPTCLLVLAYRREDVERSECLQTLQREWPPGVPRLDAPIDALTREEIASLAAATLNSLDPVGDERTRLRLDELAAESQGSPFFVREL
ncbi:MAG TPA: serine/threonine-protein kinase, partial [Pirellulales bacterium]